MKPMILRACLEVSLAVNVRDFGAVGDGKTDDTAAIRHAVEYSQRDGGDGVVYFPPGDYVIMVDPVHPVGFDFHGPMK